MKKFSKLALLVIASVALFSCGGGGRSSEPTYYLSDLQGLWQDRKDTTHYIRFTTEQSDEPNYLYGREWTEADDVYESDLYKFVYTEDSLHIDSLRFDTIQLVDTFKIDTIHVDTMILVRDSALVPTYGNGWFKYWLESKGWTITALRFRRSILSVTCHPRVLSITKKTPRTILSALRR